MTDRQLLQKALEALQIGRDSAHFEAQTYHEAMKGYRPRQHEDLDNDVKQIDGAIEAVKARLAEPEQEPVAWQNKNKPSEFYEYEQLDPMWYDEFIPLYTHPQPERKPLSEDKLRKISIEIAKLRGIPDWSDDDCEKAGVFIFASAIERELGIF